MASTISAGTTSGTALNMSGDTTGNLALLTQAGANTISVPNVTGTMMVSGNMPAFSVYQTGSQTASSGNTKIILNTKIFDTANAFDATTNYRFTPQIAGYYQVSGGVAIASASNSAWLQLEFYKNGSLFLNGSASIGFNSSLYPQSTGSGLIYMNGSTDYLELYVYSSGGSIGNSPSATFFQGCLVRSA